MKPMELYKEKIVRAIRGLDRIRFRGTLHRFGEEGGQRKSRYLNSQMAKVSLCVNVGFSR